MGDVINLNQYRKKRELELSRRQAAVNRAKYGRLKADRLTAGRERDKLERQLSQKECEPVPLSGAGNKGPAKLAPDFDRGLEPDDDPKRDEDPRPA